jgi:long-chain acyl-CoA synthetase
MKKPWDFLDAYRGKAFQGEWPTVPEMFDISAERFPERKCFTVFDPRTFSLTYGQAREKILAIAGHLNGLGIRAGDRVAVTGKNSPEWALAYLAVLYAGGTVVPLDYMLHDQEIEGLMAFAEARVLFVDEEKYDSFDAKKLKLRDKISLSPAKANYLLDLAATGGPTAGRSAGKDLAAILFTSGTTGNPKGVMLTHDNLVSDCYLAQSQMTILETDVFYALLPIHHSYTMLAVFIEAMSVGAEIVFGKKLVTAQILKDLKAGKVTMFLGVPMLFNRLIKGLKRGIREKGILVYALIRFLMGLSGFIKKIFKVNPGKKLFHSILAKISLENIRICISGGGPLPASTFRQFNQLGINFVQGYGLTETSPIVTLNPVEHYKETSVGKVIDRVEVRISEPDGEGNGEILIRGPVVMQGYYNNEEETRAVFTEDGWLKTGDIGHLDAENYLYLTGRQKSLIVTEGGKNVFPEEIEDHFQLYDEVEQILVRGFVKDAKMKTEDIEAFIYPAEEAFQALAKKQGIALEEGVMEKRISELIAEVNARLPIYKRISRFKVLKEPMEMTTTKKIKRFKIAD